MDDNSLGMLIRLWRVPDWLAKYLGPLVERVWSPSTGGMMTSKFVAPNSWQLWEKYNERLVLLKECLADWEDNQVDVVLAPGLGMPSQKLGYPAYELGAINYTCVYNLLNFPSGSVPVSFTAYNKLNSIVEQHELTS